MYFNEMTLECTQFTSEVYDRICLRNNLNFSDKKNKLKNTYSKILKQVKLC